MRLMSKPPSVIGGSAQAESPEWMPASSMCSMTPPRYSSVAVVERVDVDLDGVVEEPVDEHRVVGVSRVALGDVRRRAWLVVDDLHAAAAEHVGRAGPGPGSRSRRRCALASSKEMAVPCFGAGSPASASTRPNAPRSSARWIASGEVPTIGHAGVLERLRQAERGLAAELDDDAGDRAGLLLGVDDLQDVLQGERLEVEPVGGVVVGGDGLRVAVDHDGLVARRRSARRRRARRSSRTRCPGRCGWARSRG